MIVSHHMVLGNEPGSSLQSFFQFSLLEINNRNSHLQGWDYSSVIEHLPFMHEALGLTPSKKKKKGKEKRNYDSEGDTGQK